MFIEILLSQLKIFCFQKKKNVFFVIKIICRNFRIMFRFHSKGQHVFGIIHIFLITEKKKKNNIDINIINNGSNITVKIICTSKIKIQNPMFC